MSFCYYKLKENNKKKKKPCCFAQERGTTKTVNKEKPIVGAVEKENES
jgi:hypothetical protein